MTCHQNAASNIYKKVSITLMCISQSGLVFGNTNTFATKKILSWVGKYKVFKTHILIYESPYINLLKEHDVNFILIAWLWVKEQEKDFRFPGEI